LRERIEVLESFGQIIREHQNRTTGPSTTANKDKKKKLTRKVEDDDESDSQDNDY
jgi:hypothetical protein